MTKEQKSLDASVRIAELVDKLGGTAYYVGGYVRDRLRGKENKDVDIEIHGITPTALEGVLDLVGERITIGESFGIYSLKGLDLDVAMPRKEEKRGSGHKDFDVFVDPFIGTYKAAIRRDFTVNAMMQNVLTGEVVDHFGGQRDLELGVIRHVSDLTFGEDPLRVLRAAQFAARFGFTVAKETLELSRGMDITTLAPERIFAETEKALIKSDKPSVFFEVLRGIDKLKPYFTELYDLVGIKQNPKHHSEGDAYVHTMMVLDTAAGMRDTLADPLGFMLSALCHDLGKATTTATVGGEIHSYGHEQESVRLAEKMLGRITRDKRLTEYVLNLTLLHMKPNTMAAMGAKIKSTNKLFYEAKDPEALIALARADGLGKEAMREYVSYDDFFEERLSIFRDYMSRPYVTGKDLTEAGLVPSRNFSEILSFALKLRLAGIDKESALKQTLAYAKKLEKGNNNQNLH